MGLISMALSGCGMFKSSEAWETVMNTKIPGRGDPAQSDAYARQLQHVLAAKGIESKIVTFRYSVNSRGVNVRSDGKSVVTGLSEFSVLLYRNDTTPDNPWWMMDNALSAPVWLPNGTLEQQLRFAGRRPLEIVAVRDSSGASAVAASQRPAPSSASEPVAGDWAYLFRRIHGSRYDPASAMDRHKMATLKESTVGYIIRDR
jgi:hypothetical protein